MTCCFFCFLPRELRNDCMIIHLSLAQEPQGYNHILFKMGSSPPTFRGLFFSLFWVTHSPGWPQQSNVHINYNDYPLCALRPVLLLCAGRPVKREIHFRQSLSTCQSQGHEPGLSLSLATPLPTGGATPILSLGSPAESSAHQSTPMACPGLTCMPALDKL